MGVLTTSYQKKKGLVLIMKFTRRIICLLLAVMTVAATVLIPSAAEIPTYTRAQGVFAFDSQQDVDEIILGNSNNAASHGIEYSFDEEEKALKIVVTGSDPYIYINCLDSVRSKFQCNNISYIFPVYKAPTSNSSTSKNTNARVYLCSQACPGASDQYTRNRDFTPAFSADHYVTERIAVGSFLSGCGYFYGIRLDFFQNAEIGDVFYLDSIVLHSPKLEGYYASANRALAKNGYPVDPSTDLLCREYDVAKYTSPYWDGNIVYNEAVCPIANDDGSYTYELMYTPDEMIYVYDGAFNRYFTEGVDYTISGNKLTVIPGGSIDMFELSEEYLGDRIYFEGYLNVTYTHSDKWAHHIPENKSNLLPNTSAAIKNNDDYNVVFFGDSITGKANASCYRDFYPFAPSWWEQIEDALRETYGFSNMNVYDYSQGGGAASDSSIINIFNNNVLAASPDLLFIEFGVNDAQNEALGFQSAPDLQNEFKAAIKYMIDGAKRVNPSCEIVLVAPFYSNVNQYPEEYFDACTTALYELEKSYPGVAVADITTMHGSLLEFKRHYDTTGDNVCHPNDYMSRIYAQVCLQTIIPSELGYKAYVPSPVIPEITEIKATAESITLKGDVILTATASESNATFTWDTSKLPEGVAFTGENTAELTISITDPLTKAEDLNVSVTATSPAGYASEAVAYTVKYIPCELGDITQDGLVNTRDIFKLKLFIKTIDKPNEAETLAADINGDGLINAEDAFRFSIRILRGEWN